MKKIALCFSGHMRNWEQIFPRLEANLLKPLRENFEVDVFISTWLGSDSEDNQHALERKHRPWAYNKANLGAVNGVFKPNGLHVEDYNLHKDKFLINKWIDFAPDMSVFPNKYYIINGVLVFAAQFYKIYHSFKLAQETGREYDLMIRARPDFAPESNILEHIHFDDSIHVLNIWAEEPVGKYAVNDVFLYGNQGKMDQLCRQQYLDLKWHYMNYDAEKYPYNCNECKTQHLSLERTLFRYADSRGMDLREIGVKFTR